MSPEKCKVQVLGYLLCAFHFLLCVFHFLEYKLCRCESEALLMPWCLTTNLHHPAQDDRTWFQSRIVEQLKKVVESWESIQGNKNVPLFRALADSVHKNDHRRARRMSPGYLLVVVWSCKSGV